MVGGRNGASADGAVGNGRGRAGAVGGEPAKPEPKTVAPVRPARAPAVDARPVPEIIAELRAMPVAGLVERYQALHGRPPRVKQREWLWRRCAYRVQEQRYGGLGTTARKRLDELIAELDVPLGRGRVALGKVTGKADGEPPVGASVSRVWKGREVVATRVEGGWECQGVLYRSLTGAARGVTGSHWNGRLFFGLSQRGGGR